VFCSQDVIAGFNCENTMVVLAESKPDRIIFFMFVFKNKLVFKKVKYLRFYEKKAIQK
jgi:hypothetical protein